VCPGRTSCGWYGLLALADTPRPIVDRLAKEVAAIVADPDFAQKQLKDRSLVGATNTPDAFAAEIVEDRKMAEQVVKAAGMAAEGGRGASWPGLFRPSPINGLLARLSEMPGIKAGMTTNARSARCG